MQLNLAFILFSCSPIGTADSSARISSADLRVVMVFRLGHQPDSDVFNESEDSSFSCYDNIYLIGEQRGDSHNSNTKPLVDFHRYSEIQVAWQGPTGKIWIQESIKRFTRKSEMLLWSSMRIRHRQTSIPGASFLFGSDTDYSGINGQWTVRVAIGKREIFRTTFQIQC